MTDTTIVVPCYERSHASRVREYLDFLEKNPRYQLLFVKDGRIESSDAAVREIQKVNPDRCSWIELRHPMGFAEAIRQGVLNVFHKRGAKSGVRNVGVWNASMTTPLTKLNEFCDVLDHQSGVQLVVGTRLGHSDRDGQGAIKRQLLGRLYARLNSSLFQLPMLDLRCDAKLFRCTSATRAIFSEPFRSSHAYHLEVLLRLRDVLGEESADRFAESLWELPFDQKHIANGTPNDRRAALNSLVDYARIAWNYNFGAIEPDDEMFLDPRIGQPSGERFSSQAIRCEDLGRMLVEDRDDSKDDSGSGKQNRNPRYVIHMDRVARE